MAFATRKSLLRNSPIASFLEDSSRTILGSRRTGRRPGDKNALFACAFLTVILSGSLFTGVVFANDEPKTVPARDEQTKKLDAAKTETGRESDSDASETSAPQEPQRRAAPPLDPLFPGSEYLGSTPLIGVPDSDPEYPLEKALWSAFPELKAQRIKVYGWVNAGFD